MMTKSKVKLCVAIALSVLLLPINSDGQTVHAQTSKPCPSPTSESASVDSPSPIKYIGNAESHKFHRPSCPFARIMSLNKQVGFHYRSQAVASGHVPCRYCLPAVWTVVRGRLIAPDKTAEPEPAGLFLPPHPETYPDPPVEVVPRPP